MKNRLVDVTQEFLAKSTPGIGHIYYQDGLDMNTHKDEIEVAKWLLATFGGEITILKEKNIYMIKTPDYEWNDKYWELNRPKKQNSIQRRLRKGLHQTIFNRGGLVLDITDLNVDPSKFINITKNELNSYSKLNGYVIIKKFQKLLIILKKK